MDLVLITQPKDEIISLKETKNYLRIDHNFDDELLKMLISATRAAMETIIQKSILSQTWEYTIDHYSISYIRHEKRNIANIFDGIITVPLPKSPVVSIISVKIGEKLIEPKLYYLKKIENKCCLILNSKTLDYKRMKDSITIRYVSGIATKISNVPYQLKLANLILVANAYQERYSYSPDSVISQKVKDLLKPFLNLRIF
ncbi:MAG: phage head-tail connector protein [Alphaproteobacteria bacterium]|nr:phage head-tail connector protein [Alphaproteobacteria bacterium]